MDEKVLVGVRVSGCMVLVDEGWLLIMKNGDMLCYVVCCFVICVGEYVCG